MLTAYGWEFVSGAGCMPTLSIARASATPMPSWTSSIVSVKQYGKLAAFMHVAVLPQDYHVYRTVSVFMKECASILSPNTMRMKLDMD